MLRRLALALLTLALATGASAQSWRPGFAPGFRSGFQFIGAGGPQIPAGVSLFAVGDSITAQNHNLASDGLSISLAARGHLGMLSVLDGRVDFVQWANGTSGTLTSADRASQWGYSGQNATQIATATNTGADVIAANPSRWPVVYMAETNATGLVDSAQKPVIDALHAAGIPIIWACAPAAAQSFYGSTAAAQTANLNSYLADRALIQQRVAEIAATGGAPILFFDAYAATKDPAGPYANAAYLADDRHPNTIGSARMVLGANGLATDNSSLLYLVSQIVRPGSVWDILKATKGNLFGSRGVFAGTGGTLGTGVTGSLPAGWTLRRTSGDATAAASLIDNSAALGAGAQKLRITITGGSAASQFKLEPTSTTITDAATYAGAWVRGFMRATVASGGGIVQVPTVTMPRVPFASARITQYVSGDAGMTGLYDRVLTMGVPPYKLDAAATGFYYPSLTANIPVGLGTTSVLDVTEAWAAKIDDPRPAFGKPSAPTTDLWRTRFAANDNAPLKWVASR